MTREGPPAPAALHDDFFPRIAEKILEIISSVPPSDEKAARDPAARASSLVTTAAVKSAGISGGLALPPGPLGLITILPDLYLIWQIQVHLVSDIAAVHGKTRTLTSEAVLYCLFRHVAALAVRDLVVRAGERVLIRRATLRVLQNALRRVGVIATQRLIGRGVSRWLPFIGAAGVAAYAYYDTRRVGGTAIDLFSSDIRVEGEWTDRIRSSSSTPLGPSSAIRQADPEGPIR